ncbi:hypothetical protein [Congregibacter sp.]|uniref:hypothetical protein n=1 Tax=Congregibacter sp. TaxID=2744308 RepID=UPI003F6B74BA
MRDGLRIRLCNSQRLQALQCASLGLCLACVITGVVGSHSSMMPAALGLLLLAWSFSRVNPRGLTLYRGTLGEPGAPWSCIYPGDPCAQLCTVKSHGNLASVLWLEIHWSPARKKPGGYRTLVVFPDAVSFEHWRLLRRELRLEHHARDFSAR